TAADDWHLAGASSCTSGRDKVMENGPPLLITTAPVRAASRKVLSHFSSRNPSLTISKTSPRITLMNLSGTMPFRGGGAGNGKNQTLPSGSRKSYFDVAR